MSQNSDAFDPNLGGFVGSEDEGWALNDFDLLEYVGNDESPSFIEPDRNDIGQNDEDDTMREKDRYYATLQYNNVALPNDQLGDGYSNAPMYEQGQMPLYYVNGDNYMDSASSLLPSTSKTSAMPPVKEEMYEEECYAHSNASSDQYFANSNVGSDRSSSFTTHKMVPRKYKMKSENERRNPHYRAKREKNNDAVRRSRDKAKKEQERKERRLIELEKKDLNSQAAIKNLKIRIDTLEKALKMMEQNCTCRKVRMA